MGFATVKGIIVTIVPCGLQAPLEVQNALPYVQAWPPFLRLKRFGPTVVRACPSRLSKCCFHRTGRGALLQTRNIHSMSP
jgi:hypothetical protein